MKFDIPNVSKPRLVRVLGLWSEFERILRYHEISKRHLDAQESADMLNHFVSSMWNYVVSLLKKRSGSLSKHQTPPEAYCTILNGNDEALQLLLSDWKLLCLVEQSPNAQEIANDLRATVSKPTRWMFQLFEQGHQREGVALLRNLMTVMPDTKVIEDIHKEIRVAAKQNANQKQSRLEIQNCILNSGVLAQRGIPHTAELDKVSFMSRWKKTNVASLNWKRLFHASSEKMPAIFSKIMGPKTWPTLSEDVLARSSAAWVWLRYFVGQNLKASRIALRASRLLKSK